MPPPRRRRRASSRARARHVRRAVRVDEVMNALWRTRRAKMRARRRALALLFVLSAGFVSTTHGVDSYVCRFARLLFECSKFVDESTCDAQANCIYDPGSNFCFLSAEGAGPYITTVMSYSKYETCPCALGFSMGITSSGCSAPEKCRCMRTGDYCEVAATDDAMKFHLKGADALAKQHLKANQVCAIASYRLNNTAANEDECTTTSYTLAGQTKACKMSVTIEDDAPSYSCDTHEVTVDDLKYLTNQSLCADEKAALQATIAANSPPSPPSLSCDASTAPTNGRVGNCTSSLARGSTCQPKCNSGYTVSGVTSCRSNGKLTRASCGKNCQITAPANGGVGTCKSSLARGSTCQPTCKTRYTVSGVTSCSSSGKLNSASCVKN